jgi:ABC-type transporter Mla subunit MlaD
MITREQTYRLYVFSAAATILLIAILALFLLPMLKKDGDIYKVNFKNMSVNGINEGTDVKYRGVRIGRVMNMQVNHQDLDSILVYLEIRKGFPVKKDMYAQMQYAGITGLKFIELSGGSNQAEAVKSGGEILVAKGLGEKAEDIVLNVDSVVDAINQLLKHENREKISNVLTHIEKSADIFSRLLEKEEQHLQVSITSLNKAFSEISVLSDNLNKLITRLTETVDTLQLEQLSKSGEEAFKTIKERFSSGEMDQILVNVNEFFQTASSSMRKIENKFGGIEGEFNKTFQAFRESMQNFSQFSRDLLEDPSIVIRKKKSK